MKVEFSGQISKDTQVSSFMKICPVGAELFHGSGRDGVENGDGRTDG